MSSELTGEVTELLQTLIRNKCVNDGTAESGNESRSADTLQSYLEGSGIELDQYESQPGRASLVGRIDGSDPTAPTLLLLGHTDVVPVTEANWTFDPFGGEVVGGRVQGRGAVDMLNLTSSMAVVMRHLAQRPNRLRGSIVFAAVADEEAGGTYGAGYLTEQYSDAVKCDYALTEWGGARLPAPNEDGRVRISVHVGEKGWDRWVLRVKGRAGHASMPRVADSALIKAAYVVTRLTEIDVAPDLSGAWIEWVDAMGYNDELRSALLDPERVDSAVAELPDLLAKRAHACTHFLATPTVIHGGTKSNTIPDVVEIHVDLRPLMGHSREDALQIVNDALGDLASDVEIETGDGFMAATQSSTSTPLWNSMQKVSAQLVPGAICVPTLTTGGTDAYYFRQQGVPTYGMGLFSEQMPLETVVKIFHGDDEWVDQESLRLTTELWLGLIDDLLG